MYKNFKSKKKLTQFIAIYGHIFIVIRGLRPANLFATLYPILRYCRTCSGNLVGTSIFLRLFTVILGRDAQSVPRILLQQGTNLVNKLALLLHKCQLREDSRDKPENDGCFWCWLSICCKPFKYPSPDAHASTSPSRGEVLSNVIDRHRPANLKDYRIKSGNDKYWKRLFNTPHSTLSCHSLPQGARECGRSMIEMLGVLAIIGVLSVGGIAGYSKAMEMYKINKALEEYNFLIQGLMEHTEQLTKISRANPKQTGITDFVTAANLVPTTWKKVTIYDFIDAEGNMVGTFLRNGHWAIEIHPGGPFRQNEAGTQINPSFSPHICESIFRNLAQPLHSSVYNVFLNRPKQGSIVFYGDKYCTDGNKCLRDLTVSEINQTCQSCQKNLERCSIGMEFE